MSRERDEADRGPAMYETAHMALPYEKGFADLVKAPQRRQVPRGKNVHSLDAIHPTVFGFVSDIEGGHDDEWMVKFECVDFTWMSHVWQHLMMTKEGQRFFRLLDGQRFEAVYPKLQVPDLHHLYLVYSWFVGATIDSPGLLGPAPVSFFTVPVPPDEEVVRPALRHTAWYELTLVDGGAEDEPLAGQHSVWGEAPDEDVTKRMRLMASRFRRVPESASLVGYTSETLPPDSVGPEVIQAGLKALHFPQVDPVSAGYEPVAHDGGPATAPSAPPADPSAAPAARALSTLAESSARWIREVGARALASVDRFFEELVPAPLAVAGMGGLRMPVPIEASSVSYVGSPRDNGAWNGLPTIPGQLNTHVLNPMVPAANPRDQQPFLATLDIGQGHATMFVDHEGHAKAYFDFGYATDFTAGTAPANQPVPCFCHRPLIVLSHWDSDHWAMVRRYHQAHPLRWIAPQQHMGTASIQHVIARVREAGGQMNLWLAGGAGVGSHMRFPWGFVQRGDGPNPLDENGRNDSGLVAWVCVLDDGNDAPQPANNPLAAPPGPAANVNPNAPAAAAGIINIPSGAAVPAGWAAHLGLGAALGAAPAFQAVQNAADAAATAAVTTPYLAPIPAIAAVAQAAAQAGQAAGGSALAPAQVAADVANSAHTAATGLLGAPPAGAAAWRAAIHLARVVVVNETPELVAAAVWATAEFFANAQPAGHAGWRQMAVGAATLLTSAPPTGLGDVAALTHTGTAPPYVLHAWSIAKKRNERTKAVRETLFGAISSAVAQANVAPIAPAPAHPVVPTICGNPPPFTNNERYVVLPGDVNYGCMPVTAPGAQPIVVGLLATHHGSNRVDGSELDFASIPFAAVSHAARAASVAHAVGARPGTVIEMAVAVATRVHGAGAPGAIDAAAVAAANGATPTAAGDTAINIQALGPVTGDPNAANIAADVVAATPPAVRWAAGAAHLVEDILQNDYGGMWPGAVAASPPAVASAALAVCVVHHLAVAAGDNANVRDSAKAAAVTLGALEDTSMPAWDLAQHCLAAARAIDGLPLAPVVGLHVLGITATAAVAGAGAMAALIGSTVAHAMHPGILLGTALRGALFGQQPRFQGVETLLGYMLNRVATAVANTAAAPLPPLVPAIPATNAAISISFWAAVLGAEAGAAQALAVSHRAVRSAAMSGYLQTPIPAVAGVVSGRIAYSYGLTGTAHCHPAGPGPMGHPHPVAIAKYESRGWSERRNTPDTAASQQPDASPHGHIALGWEVDPGAVPPYNGPLRHTAVVGGQNVIQWNCGNCGSTLDLVV